MHGKQLKKVALIINSFSSNFNLHKIAEKLL